MRPWKTLIVLVAIAMLVALFGVVPAGAKPGINGKVCIVNAIGGPDDVFNASVAEGAKKARAKLHVQVMTLDADSDAEVDANLDSFVIAGDCDLIIGLGFAVAFRMEPFVAANPGQQFSVIDSSSGGVYPNLAEVLFRVDEASFLAGYVAAAVSETGKVGVFGGLPIPPVTAFMDGYALGVDWFNAEHGTDVEVLGWDPDLQSGLFAFTFQDPVVGLALAADLFDQGADTVFPVAGATSFGALDEAIDRKSAGDDVRVIGVDFDWSKVLGDRDRVILTSVIKDFGVAVFNQIAALAGGTWTAGETFEDLASGGVEIAPFRKLNRIVPGHLKNDLKVLRSGIIDGTIPTMPSFVGMSHEAESCDYGGLLKRITATDRFTVEIELCRPDVALPSMVAFPAFGIHSQGYLEDTGGTGDLIASPVGTGPYEFVDWTSEITLEPYAGYWGESAAAALALQWESDPAARLADLVAATVDGIDRPDPADYAAIEADPDLDLLFRELLNIFYIGMNRDIAPFDDERVRQAMAMAVDRERIVDLFWPQGSLVADQFLPPGMFGYTEDPAWYEYDPAAAGALLADAGYPSGFEVTLTYRDVDRRYLPTPELVASEIANQLASIDVDVTIEVMESGEMIDAVNAGDLPLYLLGWTVDYPDPTNMLDWHFGPEAPAQFGVGFVDIWDVLVAARSTADETLRLDLYQEAAELLKQHAPMIPVAHSADAVAFRSDVAGAHAGPVAAEQFAVMDPGGRDEMTFTGVAEPHGLYCGDESDGSSFRSCMQVNESLLAYEVGGTEVEPALATTWTPNADLTTWTFSLRDGVTFHDGSEFDANDVVLTYVMMWDEDHPLHVGNTGQFDYFEYFFGLLNSG